MEVSDRGKDGIDVSPVVQDEQDRRPRLDQPRHVPDEIMWFRSGSWDTLPNSGDVAKAQPSD